MNSDNAPLGRNSGAVANIQQSRSHLLKNAINRVQNCATWILRGGGKLEHGKPTANAIDAVCEGAARVDGDDESLFALSHSTANISVANGPL